MMEPELKTVSEVEGAPLSRMMKVRIKGFKTVETPLRAATRKQLESKKYTPTYSTLDNEIIIVDFPMMSNDLSEEGLNRFFRKKLLGLGHLYGELHSLHYLIPYIYPVGSKARELTRNVELLKKVYIDALVLGSKDLEEAYEISSILIPPLTLDLSSYKVFLRQVAKVLEKYDVQVIPVIDLKYSGFSDIMRFTTEDLELKVIGLMYRKIRTEITKYIKLRELYMYKDVLLMMINVPKYHEIANISDFAVTHLMNFVGIDVISTSLSRRIPVRRTMRYVHTEVEPGFRLLNREELTLPLTTKLAEHEALRLFEDAGIMKEDPKVSDIVEVLTNKQKLKERLARITLKMSSTEQRQQREATEELKRMYSITTFQEIKSSTKEFARLRSVITRNELSEYIKEKTNLRRAIALVKPSKRLLQ